jgi:primosomal protein N''
MASMKQLRILVPAIALVFSLRTTYADTVEEMGEKAVKIMERIASDGEASKGDCDKFGTALASHMDADAVTMKKIKDADAKQTKEQREANRKLMEKKYGERMKAAMTKLQTLKACKDHAKVKAYGDKVMK